ncbi:PAS domain S-box protein [Ignavibacterium sp.]|jgi:PAS domain S-box-containing protein|uniref:PAS domain S-box protein n=1 Tax=Ignavibacterium sp. TaxID=2651167 RepID=UPI0032985481
MFTIRGHNESKRKSKMKFDKFNQPVQNFSSNELEEKLNEIMIVGKIAWWQFNLDKNQMHYSSQRTELLGYNKSEMPSGFDEFISLIHEDDRQILKSTMQDYLTRKTTEHNIEYRIKHKDGDYRIFRNIGKLKISSDNERIISGIVIDITEYKKTEKSLKETEAKFKLITENSIDEIWVRDLNLNLLYVSPSCIKVHGYSPEEFKDIKLKELLTPESFYYVNHILKEELEYDNNPHAEPTRTRTILIKERHKHGHIIWTENQVSFIRDENNKPKAIIGVTRDVTQKIKSDQIREAVYRISEATHTAENLDNLFKEIHQIIATIMPAKNFYIALYDKSSDSISFPYFVDEVDEPSPPSKPGKGLTEYVLRTGEPLFASPEVFKDLVNKGEVELVGVDSFDWLGVPLKIKSSTIGVLVVQSYNPNERYTIEDLDHLVFVADQVAMAIERKRTESEKNRLNELLSAVSRAQSHLLTKKDLYFSVQLALTEIGKAVEVDRVYIFENHYDSENEKVLMSQRYEWCSENAIPQIDNPELINLPYDPLFNRWYDELSHGGNIFGLIKDFPEDERPILESQNIKSILVVPIFVSGRFWGFIGFDDCHSERIWTESEMSVLNAIASSIGGVFQRKSIEDALRKSEEKYRNFIEKSMEGIYLLQFRKPIETTLPVNKQIELFYEYGYIAEANDAMANMYGLSSSKELIGKSLAEIHGGKNKSENIESFKSFIMNGYKVENSETVEIRIDGTEIYVLNNVVGIIENNKLVANWGTQIDITERKRAEETILKAKEKAEEASRLKSNFLSNMSHELRTPLIGILGYSEIMMNELANSNYGEMASTIYQSGSRLLETLNMILTLSKVESEKVNLNLSDVSLTELVDEVRILFDSVARKKNIELKAVYPKEGLSIKSDAKILREIFNNLVNNAVKYTERGSVLIEVKRNELTGEIMIRVKDTGIGIPKDKLDIIFEEFRQASEGLARNFEGTGLGLSITKKFVQLLGGKIFVESQVGLGSTFTVVLPYNPSTGSAIDNKTIDERSIRDKILGRTPRERKSLLIVENDRINAAVIEAYVKKDYDVEVVGRGEDAVKKASEKQFDAILMDINLGSGINGVEATQQIRKIKGYEKTPIVAVTAFALKGDKEEFLAKGCSHYISKPFTQPQIIALLNEIFINGKSK